MYPCKYKNGLTLSKFCIIILFCASLAACGVRPSNLEYPRDPGEPAFPRTYPNPQGVE